MTEKLELPTDVMLGAVLLHVTGRSQIEIENFKGLLSFTPDLIVLNIQHGKVEIHGKALDIRYYSNDEIKITGTINSINYND